MTTKYYTTEQVAEILQYNKVYVSKLLREGKIEGYKLGKAWRVTEEQLEKFIKGE